MAIRERAAAGLLHTIYRYVYNGQRQRVAALTISAMHIFVDANRIDINRVRLLRRGEPGTAYVWLAMLTCGLLLTLYWFPSLPAPSLLLLRVPCRRQSVCIA